MKKLLYIILDVLTAAVLIGAYVIKYFTKRKMGMLRWMNFQNMQFQKHASYDIVKYITVAVALLLIVLIIFGYKKKKEKIGKSDLVMPLIGAAVLMQIIRNCIAVGTKKNEK